MGAAMLDGKRYFANFPDEAAAASELPDPAREIRASLARLAALEQELSRYLRDALPSERSS
jgi:hypothetical protein